MKKKTIVLLLTAALSTTLYGCSSGISYDPELVGEGENIASIDGLTAVSEEEKTKILEAYNEKYSSTQIETADFDMTMDCDFVVSDGSEESSGLSMNMAMNVDANCQMDGNLQYQMITGDIELLGMTMDMEIEQYVDTSETEQITYSKQNIMGEETGWTKTTTEISLPEEENGMELTSDMVKNIYRTEANEYVFELSFANLNDEVFSLLEGTMEGTTDSLDLDEFDFESIDAYMTFDEGLSLIGYTIDLKDLIPASTGLTADTLFIEIVFNSINEDLTITIPDEALAAEEGTVTTELESIEEDILENEITESSLDDTSDLSQVNIPSSTVAEISFNGQTLTLPCSASEIEDYGVYLTEVSTLEPGDFDVMVGDVNETDSVYISIDNFSDETLPASECTVTGISYSPYDNPVDFSFSGVTFGMSIDEVNSILGEPASTYTSGDDYASNSYEMDDIYIDVTFSDGVVSGLDIMLMI